MHFRPGSTLHTYRTAVPWNAHYNIQQIRSQVYDPVYVPACDPYHKIISITRIMNLGNEF